MGLRVTDRSPTERVLLLASAVALATGAYLPWIVPNPDFLEQNRAIPLPLLPEMDVGLGVYSGVLLAALAAAAACTFVGRRHRRPRATGVVLAGIVAVAVPVQYLLSTSLVGFDEPFVPTIGWYLAVLGGLALVVAGIVQFRIGRS